MKQTIAALFVILGMTSAASARVLCPTAFNISLPKSSQWEVKRELVTRVLMDKGYTESALPEYTIKLTYDTYSERVKKGDGTFQNQKFVSGTAELSGNEPITVEKPLPFGQWDSPEGQIIRAMKKAARALPSCRKVLKTF